MKAMPMSISKKTDYVGFEPCSVADAKFVQLHFPGPLPTRFIPVGGSGWQWNGDTENPTLSPSILTRTEDKNGPIVCHSFVRDGMIEFLMDCTHEFAGKTVPLLEVEE